MSVKSTRKDAKRGNSEKYEEAGRYNGFESVIPKLSDGTLNFIREDLKFRYMSPVQEVTIPELLRYRDVAVEACTGSGKTISYLVPVIEILLKSKIVNRGISSFNIGSLILTPTRELSIQIHDILKRYLLRVNGVGNETIIKSIACIGGDKIKKVLDFVRAEGENSPISSSISLYYVLVGTPGRVCHMFENLKDGVDWNLKSCLEIMILDEADRLLDMGFEKHINIIFRSLPKQRRTGLFSATLNTQVENLIKTGLRNPRYIKVTIESREDGDIVPGHFDENEKSNESSEQICDISVPTGLSSYYIEINHLQKIEFLVRFLKKNLCISNNKDNLKTKCIIFFLTCSSVEFYFRFLSRLFHNHKHTNNCIDSAKNDYVSDTILGRLCKLHGKMYQKSREKSYETFKECDSGILISTDLTARGIDIPDIEWIIQFDAPQDPSYYIHRIGRTARAGKYGKSLIMLQPHETAFVNYIENKTMKKIKNYSHVGDGNVENGHDYNSINDEYYNDNTRLYCDCINDKIDKELLKKDEFLEDKSQSRRIALVSMRKMILVDLDIYLAAKKAFVSYIRAYKEYQLSFIFPFKSLSIGEIASSFALFRIPRIKEILGRSDITVDFITQSKYINPDELFNLERKTTSSNQVTKVENKKIAKKQTNNSKTANLSSKERSRSVKRATKRKIEIDEWKTLCFEDKLAKKLKTGKITYQEYENKLNEFYSDTNKNDDTVLNTGSECDQLRNHKFNSNSKASSDNKVPKWIVHRKKNKKKR